MFKMNPQTAPKQVDGVAGNGNWLPGPSPPERIQLRGITGVLQLDLEQTTRKVII